MSGLGLQGGSEPAKTGSPKQSVQNLTTLPWGWSFKDFFFFFKLSTQEACMEHRPKKMSVHILTSGYLIPIFYIS